MSRNRRLISENLREEIAKELGVYDQVKQDGGSWQNVSSKDCGKIVSTAIEIANRAVQK
ncbi:MAG: small, acid-soluble spore protein, alpha/beta type [Clostridia bacterium]|nr:small, acid-soluble spore protein, alpha/beta type [Clostridia bacterium]